VRAASRDFCVIDGVAPFHLEVAEPSSRVVFVQMPRHAVLIGAPSSSGAPLSASTRRSWLAAAAEHALESAGGRVASRAEQRARLSRRWCNYWHALSCGRHTRSGRDGERIACTLAFIDAQLADPSLTAHRVAAAQGLSRRRLDQILLGSVGTSLTAQIWMRRLTQAASDLLDPASSRRR